ncbi:Gfo/Idh/MocA family oxidoreductase [SAR202 cluster bacterium AD-812-D07_MRT_10900m]|nr:Gfo/Idh/MocA family oxidoreductase [SAR202 cluster bacterium AD-812-D07_MRT_10900m]
MRKANNHRILISGLGSIGRRHLANLESIGCRKIAFHRSGKSTIDTPLPDYPSFRDLDQALTEFRPDIVFVCGPSHLHMEVALRAAEARAHLFIEKPLSHSTDGVAELERVAGENGCQVMVGYMTRFHPRQAGPHQESVGRVRPRLAPVGGVPRDVCDTPRNGRRTRTDTEPRDRHGPVVPRRSQHRAQNSSRPVEHEQRPGNRYRTWHRHSYRWSGRHDRQSSPGLLPATPGTHHRVRRDPRPHRIRLLLVPSRDLRLRKAGTCRSHRHIRFVRTQ